MKKTVIYFLISTLLPLGAFTQESKRPNILIIMADDIGISNLSYNNKGMMGYTTPNIDRIANEGVQFTDY
jgi:arylsulfatase